MEWISKIIEILKLQTKFIVIIFISMVLLLFLPKEILSQIKLDDFSNKYGSYIGFFILIPSVFIFVETILYIKNWFKKRSFENKSKKNINQKLNNLDNYEKSILREFFIQKKNTLDLPIDDPTVAGLIHSNILDHIASNGKTLYDGIFFPLKISNLVSKNLKLEQLDLPSKEETDKEKDFISKNRPSFIRNTQE